MKPTFAELKQNHYSGDKFSPSYVDAVTLFGEIGIDYNHLLLQSRSYENTCAVRMSLALIKSGVCFVGRLKILGGTFKGKMIEPGAKRLGDELSRREVFGQPDVFTPSEAVRRLGRRKGVILFWKIDGYGGGHVDLIEASDRIRVCSTHCYFSSKEIWFWPLAGSMSSTL